MGAGFQEKKSTFQRVGVVQLCLSQFLFHVQGVENVYAQHVPLVMAVVESILKAKIKDSAYPAIGPTGGKPQEV